MFLLLTNNHYELLFSYGIIFSRQAEALVTLYDQVVGSEMWVTCL